MLSQLIAWYVEMFVDFLIVIRDLIIDTLVVSVLSILITGPILLVYILAPDLPTDSFYWLLYIGGCLIILLPYERFISIRYYRAMVQYLKL